MVENGLFQALFKLKAQKTQKPNPNPEDFSIPVKPELEEFEHDPVYIQTGI